MQGSISRIVGHGENVMIIGDDVELTAKGEPSSGSLA